MAKRGDVETILKIKVEIFVFFPVSYCVVFSLEKLEILK